MQNFFSKVAALSIKDYFLLLAALFLLPLIALLLPGLGYNRTRKFLAFFLPQLSTDSDSDNLDKALHVAYLVNGIARYGYRGNCLKKSLTVWFLLRMMKIDSEIRFGVKNAKEADRIDAHAWVEYRGVNITDPEDVQKQYLAFR